MPHIKIESPKDERGRVISAHGTKVFIDGVAVTGLTDIKASWPVDGPPRVDLAILASEELSFEAAVDLHVSLLAIN